MDAVRVTRLELLTSSERWSGVIRSPAVVLAVEISDFAQGDLGAAIGEILDCLRREFGINEPKNWSEATPGTWVAEVTH